LVQITHFAIAKEKEKRLILRDTGQDSVDTIALASESIRVALPTEPGNPKAINEPKGARN
jgi:hypothetical protein